MNKTTNHNGVTYPQTEEIPAPLEIHPSVDPELARGLINAVEHIERNPAEFAMYVGLLDARNSWSGKGCFLCHVERLSKWCANLDKGQYGGENFHFGAAPIGHAVRVYSPFYWRKMGLSYETPQGRIARIEHFLKTGE